MFLKKFLLFGLMAAVLPALAEEAADRKTATSLKYVTHELDTRQDKFSAEANKAMEYTNSAGDVQKRAVTSELGTSTSDTSLPMVGGVNTKLATKQDDIAPVNDHTAVTYTGQSGSIGQKGIYQTTESYVEQSDNLIDAKTFNAALKTGLDNEFKCRDYKPDTNLCWVYSIHNETEDNTLVPEGYTPLEYIQSDGSQMIDTGIDGFDPGDWEIYVKWMITGEPTGDYPYICGIYDGESYNTYRIILDHTSTAQYLVNGNSRAGGGSARVSAPANVIHEGTIHNGYVLFDGVRYNTPTQGMQGGTTSVNRTIGLFGFVASTPKIVGRMYAAYAKQDGVMKYNYIPARRDSDNKVGMWDTVSRTFKTNSANGNDFAPGPVVQNNVYIPQNQ